jgi:hypothetical protein
VSLTIKYDATGHEIWERSVNGPVNVADGIDIGLDSGGNVYVLSDVVRSLTSTGAQDKHEFATAKYSPDGTQQWLNLFSDDDYDTPTKLIVSGNIYVVGSAITNPGATGTYNSVTVKYDLNGNRVWSRAVTGTHDTAKSPQGLSVDGTENIYVAVSNYFSTQIHSVSIYKYDPSGNLLAQFGANQLGSIGAVSASIAVSASSANAMTVDSTGHVYIASGGSPQAPNGAEDIILAEFNPDGSVAWLHDFGPPPSIARYNPFVGIAIGSAGSVFASRALVTYDQNGGITESDLSVVKANGTDGTPQWQTKYNGQTDASGIDLPVALAANSSGVYVTGRDLNSQGADTVTIKYDGSGNQVWAQRYSNSAPVAINAGGNGQVVVTGTAVGSNNSTDGVTISYREVAAGSPINVSPTTVTFSGTVGSTTAVQSVTVQNKSNSSLTITAAPALTGANAADFAIAGSTTCTNGATMASSKTCNIDVTFKATATGSRNANLIITDSDTSSPQSVSLAGAAVNPANPAATVSPATLSFSGSVGTISSAQTVTVQNKSTAPLTITAMPILTGANATDFAIAGTSTCINGLTLSSGNACSVDVTFKPAGAGSYSATLAITDNAGDSPQTVALAGMGVNPAGPVLTFSPGALTFPPEPIGTTTPAQVVTLSNMGAAVLNISLITFGGANFSDFKGDMTCGSSLAPGAACTASITFTPTAQGNRSAILSVSDNEPGSPQTVSLTGKGVGFALTCAQPTISINAGQTATFSVNVSPTAFTGAVGLTCSGAPTGASCVISPASVAVSGDASMPVTVMVTTTARSNVLPWRVHFDFYRMLWLTLLAIVVSAFAWGALAFVGNPRLRLKPSFALLTLLLIASIGCGGAVASNGSNGGTGTNGGGGTPPTMSGTPAGTSTLTMRATSGSTQATLPLTLTVN